jgi:hypothetical protein
MVDGNRLSLRWASFLVCPSAPPALAGGAGALGASPLVHGFAAQPPLLAGRGGEEDWRLGGVRSGPSLAGRGGEGGCATASTPSSAPSMGRRCTCSCCPSFFFASSGGGGGAHLLEEAGAPASDLGDLSGDLRTACSVASPESMAVGHPSLLLCATPLCCCRPGLPERPRGLRAADIGGSGPGT